MKRLAPVAQGCVKRGTLEAAYKARDGRGATWQLSQTMPGCTSRLRSTRPSRPAARAEAPTASPTMAPASTARACAKSPSNCVAACASGDTGLEAAQVLLEAGAEVNHQNKEGQTPGHFAIAYQFFDFATWLFDDSGNGGKANDGLVNSYGLGVYDGLGRKNDKDDVGGTAKTKTAK